MPDSEFYTRSGDDGYTGLLGPERVAKYDPRPEAYGTVDELQAVLGLVRAGGCAVTMEKIVLAVQRDCYLLMAELAAAGDANSPFACSITPAHIDHLERWIDELEAEVEMPKEFILPGGSQPGAALHLARTVCRRAERLVARLIHDGLLTNGQALRYLNRLSSLLFVMACYEDQAATGTWLTLARE
jgi:cob(I)alamin adenosyltransferase